MSTFELSDITQPQLLSTIELAKLINKKPQTIRAWLCQDRLPDALPRPIQINKRNYWLRNEIAEFIYALSIRGNL